MSFSHLMAKFSGLDVLVLGDLMLDEYIFGRATRISPEAPVMVVKQTGSRRVPGGAANVARNIAALGGNVQLLGVVGDDEGAALLESSLREAGLNQFELFRDSSRQTTRKTRVLADFAHQVLRIDAEDDALLSPASEERLTKAVLDRIQSSDIVVLSDYLKGSLTESICREAIEFATANHTKVLANPKPRSLHQYRGATLISLNRAEASEALGRGHQPISNDEAESAAASLRELFSSNILITLGEGGMAAAVPESIRVSAPKVEVADVAGAGDTVIATVALGLAADAPWQDAFQLAAQMAAAVVQHVGVAVPSPEDMARIGV